MNFRAMQVICMAVSTLVEEISWDAYGSQGLHSPLVRNEQDCRRLDLLVDVMGTLTRMMDTRIAYATTEGKVIREWVETILEIGTRYKKELDALEKIEKEAKILPPAPNNEDR
jgi:hypothetical protein